jgi:tRNA(Ile)-lysidine synthase
MPRFSPSALLEVLRSRVLAAPAASHDAWCVAYSGGLDSTVLLHAMARIAHEARWSLRAVHVDHQLQPGSAHWREHCEQSARELGVDLVSVSITVERQAESGLEAAAREARYDALRPLLRAGEVLLTAHHADDQLETMLLALMRGAGVRGLSAMPLIQPFGAGWLARPLLEFTRRELAAWAAEEQLRWIDDPSNENVSLGRNFLRHRIAPLLQERWPAAAHSATRAAAHLTEAGEVLDSLAEVDLAAVAVGDCVSVAELKKLEPARRRNVLRHWIKRQGVRAPSTRKLAALEHDMLVAREDRVPCIDWDGVEVRRHGGLLYCIGRQPPFDPPDIIEWDTREAIELPAQLGRLRLESSAAGGIATARLAGTVHVRFRSGGEALQPAGDVHHRKLKKLLQSAGILPWWRERVPLICSQEQLIAVGDLWVAEEFAARAGEPAVRIVWERRPSLSSPH